MEKNLLDNMSGQEIKELIVDKIITLQELSDSALEKVLDFETEMLCHNSGDMDIIRQCSEILDERNKSDRLNEDEISTIINKAKTEHVTIVDADENCPSVVAPQRKIRLIFKRIAIVAAAIIIMMATTVAIAAAFGVDISGYLSQVVRKPVGSQIVVDDFTFYHTGTAQKYSSFEEMMQAKNLDILYPTKLPDGVYIDKVVLKNDSFSEKEISITTTDRNIYMTILIGYNETFSVQEEDEIYSANGYVFYIKDEYAFCCYKDNFYSIKADSYENLKMILEGLKE